MNSNDMEELNSFYGKKKPVWILIVLAAILVVVCIIIMTTSGDREDPLAETITPSADITGISQIEEDAATDYPVPTEALDIRQIEAPEEVVDDTISGIELKTLLINNMQKGVAYLFASEAMYDYTSQSGRNWGESTFAATATDDSGNVHAMQMKTIPETAGPSQCWMACFGNNLEIASGAIVWTPAEKKYYAAGVLMDRDINFGANDPETGEPYLKKIARYWHDFDGFEYLIGDDERFVCRELYDYTEKLLGYVFEPVNILR